MKNILIINGHPDKESFNKALVESYKQGALQTHAHVEEITLSGLNFNPNLQHGYRKRMELEPDLMEAWLKIKKADHLVWVHPVWWGGLPAILKGFIDRLFLPGMAFQPKEGSVWWDKLLKGKTARIITTMDQPSWYYWLVYGRPSINMLKKSTLEFCGVKPVAVSSIGIVKTADQAQRNKWLKKVHQLGVKLK
ncbi:NAD(P)H-dependent oxidoreductase [Fulvivirga sp. 29W222]|uniref:NAD(P)H-dependent oxidoreductase n=1 Tax=Fulvivirga marina TaxID=2494733 RepID=A0A937G572_9BACT|nr:NAD(P)H-dependent oxidoreductase [Fulvivirga marina]MBL6448631.1 NAD(P)H-dependent oxidoreductase [Fulvivirga marina]